MTTPTDADAAREWADRYDDGHPLEGDDLEASYLAGLAAGRERAAKIVDVFGGRINPDDCTTAGAAVAMTCLRLSASIRGDATAAE